MADRLLSVEDVSHLTGWAVMTIYKKSAAGEIPGRMKLGKHSLRFKESEIEDWLKESADASRTRLANE